MDILSIKNIVLNLECSSKEELFLEMSKRISKLGYTDDWEQLNKYFLEREGDISTGLEDGFAIPHAKGEKIKEAGIFFVNLKTPLKWETFDKSDVTSAVFFCIPDNQGNEYLQKLALIAQALSSKEFRTNLKNEANAKKILTMLKDALIVKEEVKVNEETKKGIILGLVACPAGLAHTYMAKKALEDAAWKMNYEIHVEAHGAMGIENKISNDLISKASVIIMATDVGVETEGRFDNIQSFKCRTNDVIKDAKGVLEKAISLKPLEKNLSNAQNDVKFETNNSVITGKNKFTRFMKWWGRDTMKHLMTSISYLIPLAIAASVLIGISRILASISGYSDLWAVVDTSKDGWENDLGSHGWVGFLFSLEWIGTKFGLGTLFVPFICAFICFSMNGKSGLAPGFLVGFVCGATGQGFIGGMVCGLVTGYIIIFVSKYMKIRGSWASITPILLVPVIGTFGGGMIAWWVLGYPFHELNVGLTKLLTNLTKTSVGAPLIAAVVAAMIAFDLGGPVNKAAYGIAMGLLSTDSANQAMSDFARYTPNTATQLSIILPPLSLGLASIIGKKYYDKDLRESGKAAFIMGLVGVSEGAIPFAIKNPIRVTIINVIGCVTAAVLCVACGSLQEVSLSAFYSWGFPTKPAIYILSVLVGVVMITTPNVLLQRYQYIKKNKAIA